MGALFLHLKPDEYLKKLYKTKKLVEKTSFSLQAERSYFSCAFSHTSSCSSSFSSSSFFSTKATVATCSSSAILMRRTP
ncbi:hypothetical protein ETA15_00040 [Bacillus subtilis]|nr:hypothetical protein ETA15_00040 [Bacillus subtilis]